jgi:hypothetical protein
MRNAECDSAAPRSGWRGINPEDEITVHGPHSPYDFMSGEMRDHKFRTASGISGIHDVRRVRITDADGEACPVLPVSELSPRNRKWLAGARRSLAKLREEELAARMRRKSRRRQGFDKVNRSQS